ncbi:MAG: hypothetical protein PHV59_12690, partial [Victivallales bacterium]|nr:hypothetical protein [Victivallales bacterium]
AMTDAAKYNLARGDITLKRTYGTDTYQFQVDYEEADASDSNNLAGTKISFDTAGGTKHITEALASRVYGKDYGLKNKILVNPDGSVTGIDIPDSRLRFSETHYYARSSLSFAFVRKLKALTNRVNNRAFRGFEKGEVLFTGASGNWDDDTDIVTVTYNFEIRENEAATTIDGISCNALLGWNYRWIFYKKTKTENGIAPKAAAVIDNAVFNTTDLNQLGSP